MRPFSAASSRISASRPAWPTAAARPDEGGPAHGHEVLGRDRLAVGVEVGRRELDPVELVEALGQLGEHVVLVAAQVDRRHGPPEGLGPRQPVAVVDGGGHSRLQVVDQGAELVDPVLHRRAGEEQHPVGALHPSPHGLRPLRVGVLHEVGLVDDHHGQLDAVRRLQRPQRLVGGDAEAALVGPPRQRPVAVGPVDAVGVQLAVLGHLLHPVDQHAGRAHGQEVGVAPGPQVGERGDGLDRLAQAHLVAEDRPPLAQGELGAEGLVAAERRLQQLVSSSWRRTRSASSAGT